MGGLFLFLFLLFLPSLARYQNPTRQYLIKSVGGGSDTLNADAANFLSGFSRGSHPNRLGKVDTSQINSAGVFVWWNSQSSSGHTKDYFEGIIGISAACIFFSLLSLVTCCGFCLGRCGWNKLGGRQPTPSTIRYFPKHIYLLIAGILVFTFFMIILFAIALTSNTDVSSSEDATLVAVEGFENYLWEFMGPLNSLLNLSSTGLGVAQGMNSLIFSTLPTSQQLQSDNQCLNTSYQVFQLQDDVRASLININNLINGTVNFTTFAGLFSQLSTAILITPSLDTFDIQAKQTKVAIQLLPSMPPVASSVSSLELDLAGLTNIQPTINSVNNLKTTVSGLGLTSITNLLTQFETSVSTLPNLPLIVSKINGSQPSTQADMQSNLTALNTSLATFPDMSQIATSLSTLSPKITQLQAEVVVKTNLTTIRNIIQDLAFLPSLITSLQQIDNVRNSVEGNVTNLIISAIPINNNFTSINTTINQLLPLIPATQSAVNSLSSAINNNLVTNMNTLQTNLPTISCLNNVYDQLLAINNSVFLLPNETVSFFQTRTTIQSEIILLANLTQDINASAEALTAINNSLSSFPNFTQLTTQLQALLAGMNAVPMNQLLTELIPLYNSFITLPSLPPMITALTNLNVAINIPTLSTAITVITQMSTTLTTVPSLAVYISSFNNLASSKNYIDAFLSDAIGAVDSSGNLPAPYHNNLILGINEFDGNLTNRPSTSTLNTSLINLNNDVNSLPNLTTLANQLSTLQNTSRAVPLTNAFSSSILVINSSLPQTTLNAITTGNPDAIQTVATLFDTFGPLFNTQSTAMTVTQDALNQYNVDTFLATTNGSSTWLTQSMVTVISATLTTLVSSRDQLVTFNTTVNNLTQSVNGLSSQINDFTSKRYSFDSNKNSVYNQVQSWDLIRLFLAFFLVALPVLVLLFGVIAGFFKKPCFAMVMALSAFGIVALFFFLAAMQVPIATFTADQCSNPNEFIQTQLTGENISASEFYAKTGIKVTQNVSLLDSYEYLFHCQGQRPEFLTLLDDPTKLLNDTTPYNFTTLRADIVAASGNLVLNPSLYNQFDVLNGLVNEATVLINNTMQTLVQCQQLQVLEDDAIDAVCTQFAGAFALNTCLYALFAICITPSICMGVKGYKWFNPRYRAGPGDLENLRQEKEPIAMTPKPVKQSNKGSEGHRRDVSHLPPGAIRGDNGAVFIPDSKNRLWVCGTCTYNNQPSVVICQVCGTPRGEESSLNHSQMSRSQNVQSSDGGFVIEPVNENPGAIDVGGGAFLVPVHHDR